LTWKPITAGRVLSIPVWRIESHLTGRAVSMLLRFCSHGRKSLLADCAETLLRRRRKEGSSRLTHSLLSSVKRLRSLKRLKRRTWGNQSRAAANLNRTKDPDLRRNTPWKNASRTRRRWRRRDPQRLSGISENSHSQCLSVRHDAKSLQ
jgi:hypothetical protein